MNATQAHIAYNILVLYAGADPAWRADFVLYATRPLTRHEFRFQGSLGFGGKIYFSGTDCWVNCYPEHETPESLRIIAQCNRLLELLYE